MSLQAVTHIQLGLCVYLACPHNSARPLNTKLELIENGLMVARNCIENESKSRFESLRKISQLKLESVLTKTEKSGSSKHSGITIQGLAFTSALPVVGAAIPAGAATARRRRR